MEEVKRQFGQHIAVEPEWEAGFSLQIQLRHILTMFQEWCSSDVSPARQILSWLVHSDAAEVNKRGVNGWMAQLFLVCSRQDEILLLAFKECHKVLMQCNNQPFQREAADFYMCKHILHVRPYKVSQQPVSIHLPISRLLAGRRTNIWFAPWFISILLIYFLSAVN